MATKKKVPHGSPQEGRPEDRETACEAKDKLDPSQSPPPSPGPSGRDATTPSQPSRTVPGDPGDALTSHVATTSGALVDAVLTVAHSLEHAHVNVLKKAQGEVWQLLTQVREISNDEMVNVAAQRILGALWAEIEVAIDERCGRAIH